MTCNYHSYNPYYNPGNLILSFSSAQCTLCLGVTMAIT